MTGFIIELNQTPQETVIIADAVQYIIVINEGSQGVPGDAGLKGGVVAGASFTGSPRKHTVVFAVPFADTDYAITFGSGAGRSFTYESKTINGFIINSNAAAAIAEETSWMAFKSRG